MIKYQIYCTQIKIHLSGCLNSPSWAAVQRQRAANLLLVLVAKKPLQSREPPDLSRPLSLDQVILRLSLSWWFTCALKFRIQSPGLHQLLEISHWWFTCAPSISFHRPELHQCCPPLETCWTASILVSYSEITTESGLSRHPTILPSCTFRKMNVLTK